MVMMLQIIEDKPWSPNTDNNDYPFHQVALGTAGLQQALA